MRRQLYSVLLLLAVPFIVIRLILKSIGLAAYRKRIGERFASFTTPANWESADSVIWIHAVSVGEVVASAPLVKALQEQLDANIAITTSTPTGSDRVTSLFGDRVFHVYSPYDLGIWINRFIAKVRPKLLIIMETELWPNMLHSCQQQGVKVLLANARLSEKSATGYQRFSGLSKEMLHNIDHIAAQAQADADRFITLGARADTVSITGSLKFYLQHSGNSGNEASIFSSVNESERMVLIAASTRDGEEEKVLQAYKKIKEQEDSVLLVLVPRHPERFDKVASLCSSTGFSVQRRSEAESLDASTDILLGDSMGEMLDYYQLASIAFVGGSLVDTGCQNVIEPAALGIPVVVGPSQFNFATICAQLEAAGALCTVQDSKELARTVVDLLVDSAKRQKMGEAGKALVSQNQNALPLLMAKVE